MNQHKKMIANEMEEQNKTIKDHQSQIQNEINEHKEMIANQMEEQNKTIHDHQNQIQNEINQQSKMIENNESEVISLRECQDEREQKFGDHIVQNIIQPLQNQIHTLQQYHIAQTKPHSVIIMGNGKSSFFIIWKKDEKKEVITNHQVKYEAVAERKDVYVFHVLLICFINTFDLILARFPS